MSLRFLILILVAGTSIAGGLGGIYWLGMPYFLITLGVIAVGVAWSLHRRHQLRSIRRERADLSICTFVKAFDYRRIDTWVLRAVYEEVSGLAGFPVKPEDDIYDNLQLGSDDLNDALLPEIADRCGRDINEFDRNPYTVRFEEAPTVSNLVMWFQHQPLAA